jgi:indole-3-glycerol phosphate synthase
VGILQRIVSEKKKLLKDVKASFPLRDIMAKSKDAGHPRDLLAALRRHHEGNIRLVAEIKKASPSKGIIRKNFDHLTIAKIYESKHVDAISVLTEENYFMGNLAFIPEVRGITSKPVLRKDFICDAYQIYESRAYEADAVLLIAAMLDKNQADEYLHLARELGLSVLFEIHDHRELEMALLLPCEIIGINNRNLKTLEVDMQTTFTLMREIPADKIVVSESGIKNRTDVQKLREIGVDAMLIGTSFMQSDDIAGKIDELMGPM